MVGRHFRISEASNPRYMVLSWTLVRHQVYSQITGVFLTWELGCGKFYGEGEVVQRSEGLRIH